MSTPFLTYVQARIASLNAEMEAMKAANSARAFDRQPPKYFEHHFKNIADQLNRLAGDARRAQS